MLKKSKNVTIKIDPEGKKMLKELAIELDTSMIKLTKEMANYTEEFKELLKKKNVK